MELVTKWYKVNSAILKTLVLCGNPEDSDGLNDMWMPFSLNLDRIVAYKMSSPADSGDIDAGLTTVYTENIVYIVNIPYESFDSMYSTWKGN